MKMDQDMAPITSGVSQVLKLKKTFFSFSKKEEPIFLTEKIKSVLGS